MTKRSKIEAEPALTLEAIIAKIADEITSELEEQEGRGLGPLEVRAAINAVLDFVDRLEVRLEKQGKGK